MDSLVTNGKIESYSLGTVMLPKYNSKGAENPIPVRGSKAVDVEQTKWARSTETETEKGFSAVLLNIPLAQKERMITARAYLTVTIKGTEYTYYGDVCDRSISDIADAIIDTQNTDKDEYTPLKPEYKVIVKDYATKAPQEVQENENEEMMSEGE